MTDRPYIVPETQPQSYQHLATEEVGDSLHQYDWQGKIASEIYQQGKRAVLNVLGARDKGYLRSFTGALSHGGGLANGVVAGTGLIPAGWRQATLQVDVTDATASIIWEAIRPGEAGNSINIAYVDNGGVTAVAWDDATRTVTVGLDIAGAGDTAANVVAALAASATGAQYVVQTRYPYGLTGAGTIDEAVAATPLAGGTGVELLQGGLGVVVGANRDYEWIRRDAGLDSKPVSVSITNLGGMTTLPTVVVTETNLAVTVAVTATIATHTVANLIQAIHDSAAASEWVDIRLAMGHNGTGVLTAYAATLIPDSIITNQDSLAVGGEVPECVPCAVGNLAIGAVQNLTNDGFTLDIAAGAGAAGTTVMLRTRICGVVYEIPVVTVA